MRPFVTRAALGVTIAALAWVALSAPAEAQRRRGRDRARAETTGTLVVQGSQPGAEVFVDEQPVGTTPLEPLTLAPGSHTLRVRLPGYTEHTDVFRIEPGQATEVPIDLIALSELLSVVTEPPGAHVYVDGNFMGETPVEFDLLEGAHSLRVTSRGFEETIREIEARAGRREEISIDLVALPEGELGDGPRVTQWYEEPVTWIAVGGGAVAIAIVIAVVAVVTSGSSTSQLDQFCAPGCIRHDTPW
ncbi:MAG: PEGA domain-containing protein [Myxococcota bacterium]|nr:PEGA domain-containing protein [Myxococcota bacterium]